LLVRRVFGVGSFSRAAAGGTSDDVRTWKRFACQVAGRDLTQAEWRDLLPQRSYQHVCP
jgi:hypothetical protein